MELSLYMVKRSLHRDSWGLRRESTKFEPVRINPIGDLDAELFVIQSIESTPTWIPALLGIVSPDDSESYDKLLNLKHKNAGGQLRIRRAGYRFILTYGSGWRFIDPSAIETGFGLRVVANSLNPNALTSADLRSLTTRGKSSKVMLAAAGGLDDLGVEPTQDLVRQLEGRPPMSFADGIAGADTLRLKKRNFSLRNLPEKLDQIIARYESTGYQRDYPFLDYFVRIPRGDKGPTGDLDRKIELLAREGTGLDYASPDVNDNIRAVSFTLKNRNRKVAGVYNLLPEEIAKLASKWNLERPLHEISVIPADEHGESLPSRRLIDYVAAEVEVDDEKYAICSGHWYHINRDHAAEIQQRIIAIPELNPTDLSMIPWQAQHTTEEIYNEDAAQLLKYAKLDRNLLSVKGRNQRIEICDLLTPTKQLVCVKKMQRSSTLSHLFAQGFVSAKLFVDEYPGYREFLTRYLTSISPNDSVGRNDEWTIVYALATHRQGPLADSLYFFSKVQLAETARQLRRFGLRVALSRIDLIK